MTIGVNVIWHFDFNKTNNSSLFVAVFCSSTKYSKVDTTAEYVNAYTLKHYVNTCMYINVISFQNYEPSLQMKCTVGFRSKSLNHQDNDVSIS